MLAPCLPLLGRSLSGPWLPIGLGLFQHPRSGLGQAAGHRADGVAFPSAYPFVEMRDILIAPALMMALAHNDIGRFDVPFGDDIVKAPLACRLKTGSSAQQSLKGGAPCLNRTSESICTKDVRMWF